MDQGIAVELTLWAGAIAAGGAAGAVLAKLVRWVLRRGRQIGHFLDDVLGEPAHGDQPARSSLMVRVGSIEAELHPNHGTSLRDVVDRVERRQERETQRLDGHLAEHLRTRDCVVRVALDKRV